MNEDYSDNLFASTLRIFLSVDIVGSTAFKQTSSSKLTEKYVKDATPAEPWFSPIAQFYRGIEHCFYKEWINCKQELTKNSWPCGEDPELWKSVGDELVYTKTLYEHREALSVVHAWIRAITEYQEILQDKFPSLDLKSTAWIAGFPVYNAEIIFQSSKIDTNSDDEDDPLYSNLLILNEYKKNPENPQFTRDFIGPAIDMGFRLSHFASARRMVISVDLALLLVNASRVQPPEFAYPKLNYFYQGRETLKGVFGGVPYPVFWIDMRSNPQLEEDEDKLNNREPANSDHMKSFCENFIKSNARYSFVPYMRNSTDPYFSVIPDHHSERIVFLKEYWINERSKRSVENKSGLQSDGENEDGQSRIATEVKPIDYEKLAEAINQLIRLNSQDTE